MCHYKDFRQGTLLLQSAIWDGGMETSSGISCLNILYIAFSISPEQSQHFKMQNIRKIQISRFTLYPKCNLYSKQKFYMFLPYLCILLSAFVLCDVCAVVFFCFTRHCFHAWRMLYVHCTIGFWSPLVFLKSTKKIKRRQSFQTIHRPKQSISHISEGIFEQKWGNSMVHCSSEERGQNSTLISDTMNQFCISQHQQWETLYFQYIAGRTREVKMRHLFLIK